MDKGFDDTTDPEDVFDAIAAGSSSVEQQFQDLNASDQLEEDFLIRAFMVVSFKNTRGPYRREGRA